MHPPRFTVRWFAAAAALPLLAGLDPRVARGDDHEEQAREAKIALAGFSSSVKDVTATGVFGNNFYNEPAACAAAVASGTAAGLGPTDPFLDGAGATVLWKRAPQICADYARLFGLGKTVEAIRPMFETIRAFSGPDGKPDPSVTGDAYRATVARVTPCLAIIDKAIDASAPADVPYAPFGNQGDTLITLTDARKVCSDYLSFGAGAAKADDAKAAGEVSALKTKYGKLGIAGDRLEYLVKWGHKPVLGKGCVELTGKALKTSAAFFDLGQDDLAWIVYKTQFKGDKQVKYTQKRFRKDGDYSCK